MQPESKISARKITAAQLEEKATAMRLAGMSCAEIGKQLGVNASTVWRAIQRAKKRAEKLATDTWEEMRDLEAERLDRREVRINTLIQEASTVKRGEKTVAIPANPDTIVKLDARLEAIGAARRKLWGLDAPAKASMASIDLAKLTTAQLERLTKGEDLYVVLADAGASGA